MRFMCIIASVVLLSACSKSTECIVPDTEGIVGKWKLVKVAGIGIDINVEDRNYVVVFDSMGKVHASNYPCAGTYTFDDDEGAGPYDINLVVDFNECDPSIALGFTIHGSSTAHFADNNTLVLSYRDCDEGCAKVYERVCD